MSENDVISMTDN